MTLPPLLRSLLPLLYDAAGSIVKLRATRRAAGSVAGFPPINYREAVPLSRDFLSASRKHRPTIGSAG